MAINNPPISDNLTRATWDLEVTNAINLLEEKTLYLEKLLEAIKLADNFDEFQTSIIEEL